MSSAEYISSTIKLMAVDIATVAKMGGIDRDTFTTQLAEIYDNVKITHLAEVCDSVKTEMTIPKSEKS